MALVFVVLSLFGGEGVISPQVLMVAVYFLYNTCMLQRCACVCFSVCVGASLCVGVQEETSLCVLCSVCHAVRGFDCMYRFDALRSAKAAQAWFI